LRRLSGKNALDEQLGIGLPCGGRDTLKQQAARLLESLTA
jgi:hypothetical protein